MIIPHVSNLVVRCHEQILIIKINEGIVPVRSISATYKQSRSTHGHHIRIFAHVQEFAGEKTGPPVNRVEIPF